MDLRDVLRAVRRRWWMVVSALVVALGTAAVLTALAVPQYATTLTFFVTTPGDGVSESYQGGLFSQQRVKSYADLLRGDRLARAVAGSDKVDLAASQIQQRITARPVPDTVLLEVTVTDSSPVRSMAIATALGEHFAQLVSTLETPPGGDTSRAKVEIVEGPTLNPVPVSPRPARTFALATLLGLIIGAAAAVLREMLDVTIKNADTLRDVADAPVLATIPLDGTAKREPLVMDGDRQSSRAEALRHLRTNLKFVDVDNPVKVVAITSSLPAEGKTTTSVNLAIAFAKAGLRVLLIEADMRRPRVAEYLSLEGAVGLSNVLAGLVPIDQVLQRWGSNELYVLTGGFLPPNPSELLGSRNMATLLDRERERFDLILVDTPPLVPVTDAAVIAPHTDGVVLVTRAGKTSQTHVRSAVSSLRAVDARLLGCVLNMHPQRTKDDYYSYAYRKAPRNRTPLADVPVSPVDNGVRTPR